MGATEEQLKFLSDSHVTHVSYILILYSIAFLLFLFVNILLHLYAVHAWPDSPSNGRMESRLISRSISGSRARAESGVDVAVAVAAGGGAGGAGISKRGGGHGYGHGHGHSASGGLLYSHSVTNGAMGNHNSKSRMPRHKQTDSQHIRDAETFELEGLIAEGDGGVEEEDLEMGSVASMGPGEGDREGDMNTRDGGERERWPR